MLAQPAATATDTKLTFTVLQIPDMHFTGDPNHECRNPSHSPCTEADMPKFISTLLDNVKPDLVVFTGDQVEDKEVIHV